MENKLQGKEYGISTLKGLIGAIPFAGTFLNEIAFEARSRIKQERVNNFIEQFSEYMNSHTQAPDDYGTLNEERISDVFEEIVISVSKTSAEHKHEVFKKILFNELRASNTDSDEILRFIRITNNLSAMQFKIISTFGLLGDNVLKYRVQILELDEERKSLNAEITKSKEKNETHNIGKLTDRVKKIPGLIARKRNALQRGNVNPNSHKTFGITRSEYIVDIQDLIAQGLIFDFAVRTFLINPYEVFGITRLGRRYLNYISTK
jgi:hypothetical protein